MPRGGIGRQVCRQQGWGDRSRTGRSAVAGDGHRLRPGPLHGPVWRGQGDRRKGVGGMHNVGLSLSWVAVKLGLMNPGLNAFSMEGCVARPFCKICTKNRAPLEHGCCITIVFGRVAREAGLTEGKAGQLVQVVLLSTEPMSQWCGVSQGDGD